jgi:CRISPR/Cas system-associated exonuclease Cas4 (RecB family)
LKRQGKELYLICPVTTWIENREIQQQKKQYNKEELLEQERIEHEKEKRPTQYDRMFKEEKHAQ